MLARSLNHAIFPAPPASYSSDSFPGQLLRIPQVRGPDEQSHEIATDEQKIPCLFIAFPSARYMIIFLHGNAEDIGSCYEFCRLLRDQFQCHLLVPEYPGYGQYSGSTSEHGLAISAFSAMNFAIKELNWELDSIKIMGRSIGSAPALRLSAYYQSAGLILVAPFLSLRHIISDLLGPVSWIVEKTAFSNESLIQRVKSPVLIIHGKMDMLICSSQSERLYDMCKTRKLLVLPREMDHNTHLMQHVGFFVLPMLQFFQLPDYSFTDICVPNWAFFQRPYSSRKPEVSETCSAILKPILNQEERTPVPSPTISDSKACCRGLCSIRTLSNDKANDDVDSPSEGEEALSDSSAENRSTLAHVLKCEIWLERDGSAVSNGPSGVSHLAVTSM